MRSFIREFEKSQQEKGVDVDRDGEMVQKYMTQMENVFVSHPVWKGDVQEVADLAVEVCALGFECMLYVCLSAFLNLGMLKDVVSSYVLYRKIPNIKNVFQCRDWRNI